jgi:hypothetical protein
MPKETAAFIVVFGVSVGVLWSFLASISIVDRAIPPITTLAGAATWLLLWPGYHVGWRRLASCQRDSCSEHLADGGGHRSGTRRLDDFDGLLLGEQDLAARVGKPGRSKPGRKPCTKFHFVWPEDR